jgi:hypothetical protein
VIGDQSVFKNLSKTVETTHGKTATEWLSNALRQIAVDTPSSFAPGLLRQIRGLTDPYARDTQPEGPRGWGNAGEVRATGTALLTVVLR